MKVESSSQAPTTKTNCANNQFGTTEDFYLFRILQSLRQNIRAIEQYSYKLSSQYHITAPQLICLTAIRDHGAIPVAEVARRVHLSPSTVVGIFNRLEKKGLIARHPHEHDKRRTVITLTDVGRALIQKAPQPLQEQLANSFGKLSETEQLSIVTALEKVVDMIQARDLDAAPVLETGPLNTCPETRNTFWKAAEINPISQPNDYKSSSLTIRAATDADEHHISRFINSSFDWYARIIDEKDVSDHAVDDSWVRKNMRQREFYIAETEGKPVGTVSLQYFGEYAYLGYVFIDANEVGKGFGRKLLKFAEQEAKHRGMKGMALIAHPQARWAIKAYQKFGFKLKYRNKEDILAWNNGALKSYYEEFFMLFLYHF
ncbi:bifunctional helix-turn-helix transcriptional regulator/GNAT family N-acetyltransferase [Legionella yabuuchiae]|uniref:bifunctional helix-turn-helix transcriptional regulator/GNAT family N-acetyltransferase n=1 Tax=Legionella yabuuchiae TaxID=376727 RepID=UPI0010543CDD|nr:bifunctional helix-turn-helix transcriptional regulator/GNAT family N-acetyltransferase [Legionella yabuuchiae]